MSQLNPHNPIVLPPPNAKLSTTDLPILQKASRVYKAWHSALPNLPRLTRYTLGAKIDQLLLEAIEIILLAGYAARSQKLPLLMRASGKLDLLKFFLQLCWEMKVLDNKKYLELSAPLIEISKMLGGWRKQVERVLQPKQNSLHTRWREK